MKERYSTMKLWHYKLIPFLLDKQLKKQLKTLNYIINRKALNKSYMYVHEYGKEQLLVYIKLVENEMKKRNLKIKELKNYNNYFKRIIEDAKAYENFNNFSFCKLYKLFPCHHTEKYFEECYTNLVNMYKKRHKSSEIETYNKLISFYKKRLEHFQLVERQVLKILNHENNN